MVRVAYKRCSLCGEEKAADDFYPFRQKDGGLQSRCKECQRAERQKWDAANRERINERQRRYRKRCADKAKQWRQKHRERHPDKAKSRQAVENAVRSGELTKPSTCEDCGKPFEAHKLHGHHEDYDKPFDVEWLCGDCHTARHAEERE